MKNVSTLESDLHDYQRFFAENWLKLCNYTFHDIDNEIKKNEKR